MVLITKNVIVFSKKSLPSVHPKIIIGADGGRLVMSRRKKLLHASAYLRLPDEERVFPDELREPEEERAGALVLPPELLEGLTFGDELRGAEFLEGLLRGELIFGELERDGCCLCGAYDGEPLSCRDG